MGSLEFRFGNGILRNYNSADYYTENVVVPDKIKIIKTYAFKYGDMSSIEFNNDLERIEDFAFYNCKYLKTIIIPKTLKQINGKTIYKAPSLSSIIFKDDSIFSFCDNYIFNKKENIFEALFYLIEGIFNVPSFIKKINSYAFFRCEQLSEIILNEGLEEINSFAFSGTPLKEIKIPKSVKHISPYAFEECVTLEQILVDKDNPYFTSIGGVLYSKDLTSLIAVPKSKEDSLIMPDSVTHIYKDAFYFCMVSDIYLSKNLTETTEINELKDERGLFEGCTNLLFIKPGNPKFKISFDMFKIHGSSPYYTPLATSSLQRFFFQLPNFYPSQLTPYYQKQALSMILPNLMKKSAKNKDLESAWYKYIKRNASKFFDDILEDKKYFDFVIREKLLTLKDTKLLIELTTQKKLIEKTSSLLEYQNKTYSIDEIVKDQMKELSVDTTSKSYIRKSFGLRLIKNETEYEIISYKGKDTIVIVPDNIEGKPVTSIADGAFSPTYRGIKEEIRNLRRNITSITLPDTITRIGNRCLWDLSSLTSLTLSKGLKEIPCSEFNFHKQSFIKGCTNLTSLVIPEGVEIIGNHAFSDYQSNLKHITLPSTLKTINEYSFYDCRSLEELDIPEGVTTIQRDALDSCKGIKKLTIPSTVEKLGDYSISYLEHVEVTINNPSLKFTDTSFWNCKQTTFIVDANSETETLCKKYKLRFRIK